MKNAKQHIALLFIAMMLVFKVAGLHALTHLADEGEAQHCELCVVTAEVSVAPLLEAETPLLQLTDYFFEQKLNIVITNVDFNNRHLSSSLLTRPPPPLS
jgi:hypothetical protein